MLFKRLHREAVLAAIARRELLHLLALAATGCVVTRAPREASALTVAWPASEWDFLFTDSSSQFLVFLPLVSRNARGEIEGRLARSWERSPDYRTWTVRLRAGLTWHDGRPVTAHDVKFTLDLFMHPDVLLMAPGAVSMTVLDESTYTIAYHTRAYAAASAPVASPYDDYTVYYPKHLLENLDPKTFRRWEFWKRPVGNGPYRVVRHLAQTMMEFEANPDYYRGQPKIERVVLKFLPGAATEATELASGNVQAAWVPRADLLKLRRDPRFLEYYSIGPHILRTIAWNQRHPFFHDTAVRLALTLAIDRRELYQALNLPDAIPILDGPTARYAPWRELPDPLPYDPARAKELLEGAGWLDTDGDGAREREGQRFRFAMLNQAEGGDAAAVYVQAALRRVGVEVQIQRAERRVIQQRIGAGRFDAASLAMNFGTQALLSWFGPESVLGYSAGRATPVLGRLESTLDPDEIARLHRELMLILQADVPATFLFPNVETTVASRNLRGLSSPYHADALRYLENLWLEEVS